MKDEAKNKEQLLTEVQELRNQLSRLKKKQQPVAVTLKAAFESEKRYRELFAKMQSGVAVYRPEPDGQDFIFVDYNRAAEKMDNKTKEEVLGKLLTEVFPGVKEFGLFEVLQRVWATGKPEKHPASVYRDDRLLAWRENHIYKLPSGEIVAIYDDVTERYRMNELIRVQRDMALALADPCELSEALMLCLTMALKISDMDCGGIYLVDEQTGDLDLVVHSGLSPEFIEMVRHYGNESASASMVKAGKPVYTNHQDIMANQYDQKKQENLKAIAIIPIIHTKKIIACLNVSSHAHDNVPEWSRSTLETIGLQIGRIINSKMAEAKLHAAEGNVVEWKNRYETAVKASGYILYDWDSVTDEVTYGGSIEPTLGYTLAEMAGGLPRWIELIHPDDRDEFSDAIQKLIETKTDAHLSYRIRKKTGEYITIEDDGNFFFDANGELVRMIGFIKDITSQHETQERFQAITDTALDSIFCKDLERRYTFANPAMEQMLGRTADEIIGKTPVELFGEENAAIIKEVDDENYAGRPVNTVRTLKINSKEMALNVIQVPLRDAQGNIYGISGIVRNQ